MKSAGSTVGKETSKAVQGQFSHLYKVMGERVPGQSNNALALMQKGSREPSSTSKKK
jgi:hypothetical protein